MSSSNGNDGHNTSGNGNEKSLTELLKDDPLLSSLSSSSNTQQSSSSTITMKKKSSTSGKRFRRASAAIEDDEDNKEETSAEAKKRLEEVKLLQRVRGRTRGVGTGGLENGDAAAVTESDPNDIVNPEAKLLANEFQAEVVVHPVDKQMEKYIAEKLAERQGKSANENEDKKTRTLEDQLYETPDHLKYTKALTGQEEEAGERWLTGIAEVPLDISYKIKNIEETELAKQELAANRGKPPPPTLPTRKRIGGGSRTRVETFVPPPSTSSSHNKSSSSVAPLPANVSVNFTQHNKDFLDRVKGQSSSVGGGIGNNGFSSNSNRNNNGTATDDRAVDRFMKRQKWHK